MIKHDTYESPLSSRYASKEISFIFSPEYKYVTWRRLWIALAKAQKSLGLPVTQQQIHSLEAMLHHIDYAKAAEYERIYRHDVMAHIHAYGDACPDAKGIIHWGATSCYVTDNGDLIQMLEGLKILRSKIVYVIRQLATFAEKHAHLACLGFTHFQSAQPTTVGKRAALWIQDLLSDFEEMNALISNLHFLGAKGATGTQASFLLLFDNDSRKVKRLDTLIAEEMGFTHLFSVTGQTYSRKQDMRVLAALSGIAASAHKFATDLRLLAHLKEVEEPFQKEQIGSSAMPYKRNPIYCERISGIARFLLSLNENPAYTAATQWLERSLDDSSNRRLVIPQAFLCADAILNLLAHVASGPVVYPKVIAKHLQEELPFLATENILMEAVKKGKDRQMVHERLRIHTHAAARRVKEEGADSDLLSRIAQDPAIGLSEREIQKLFRPELFIGRAPEQTLEFLHEKITPLLKRHKDLPFAPSHVEM